MEEKIEEELALSIYGDKMNLMRTEFITRDTKPDLQVLCSTYSIPISYAMKEATENKWEVERQTYQTKILNEIQEQTKAIKIRSQVNTMVRASKLQKSIFDSIEQDIKDGKYQPTVKEFVEISKILSNEEIAGSNVNSNNKIININMQKPIEEMTFEEIVALENDVQQQMKGDESE